MKYFLRFERVASGIAGSAACLLLAVLALLCFFQVLARFILHIPSPWSDEISRMCLIWMAFLGATIPFRRGIMIRVDFLVTHIRGGLQSGLNILILITSLSLLGLLVWVGALMANRVQDQTLSSIELSIGWGYLAIPVGALLCMISIVAAHADPAVQASDPEPLETI